MQRHLLTTDGASWVEVVPRAIVPPAGAYDELEAVMRAVPPTPNPRNRTTYIKRRQATYVEAVNVGGYAFGAQRSAQMGGTDAATWPKLVRLALADVRARDPSRASAYVGAHLNFYEDGSCALSRHSDDDGPWDPSASIYSYTFYSKTRTEKPRSFRIWAVGQEKPCLDLPLAHGDLAIMGGTMQTTHEHGVPACVRKNARINITIRALARGTKRARENEAGAGV